MSETLGSERRQEGYRRLWELLRANGGNGLFRFIPDGDPRAYQIVVLAFQVVGVTRDGEYQSRNVAEALVRALAEQKGDVEWIPFPGYYPPIHLLFYLPLQQTPEHEGKGHSPSLSEET